MELIKYPPKNEFFRIYVHETILVTNTTEKQKISFVITEIQKEIRMMFFCNVPFNYKAKLKETSHNISTVA